MVTLRGQRDYRLVLRGPQHRVLATETVELAWNQTVFSQRRFLASPDGRWLAYAKRDRGRLLVRGAGGRELAVAGVNDHDIRFSPDGRYLAAVTGSMHGKGSLVIVDLRTGRRRRIPTRRPAAQVEWVRGGVVASIPPVPSFRFNPKETYRLEYLALDGRRRLLAETIVHARFAAASRGDRVIYFELFGIHAVDVRTGARSRVSSANTVVSNVEMSPDGARTAYVDRGKLYLIEGVAPPVPLDTQKPIHTVWFSRDGRQLAWAGPDRIVLGEWVTRESQESAASRREAPARGSDRAFACFSAPKPIALRRWVLHATSETWPIRSFRFIPGGSGPLVVAGGRVLWWRPDLGRTLTTWTAPAGVTPEASDLFDGGLVVWMSKVRPKKTVEKRKLSQR